VKHKSKQQRTSRPKPPRTAAQYFVKPPRQRASLVKTAHVVTAMRRDGLSLKEAAREVGIRPETVQRHAGSALRKTKSGKYEARASDNLLRPIVVVAPGGLREVVVRDSASATIAAEHSNAVHAFLQTGDDTELQAFRGQSITDVDGKRIPLLTDLNELERLGAVGVLSFESIYAKVS
jgi:DNA-binding CsgD family transcriptional regulator